MNLQKTLSTLFLILTFFFCSEAEARRFRFRTPDIDAEISTLDILPLNVWSSVGISLFNARNGQPLKYFCFQAQANLKNIQFNRNFYCTDRYGVASLQARSALGSTTQVSLHLLGLPKRSFAKFNLYFGAPLSLRFLQPTMYRNQCADFVIEGGVPPYQTEVIQDDSRGWIDGNSFCGGDGTNGTAVIQVTDLRGVNVEASIIIYTPPAHEISLDEYREELFEGECAYFYSHGNGGEFFIMQDDPSGGSLFNDFSANAVFCAGSGLGVVKILASDRDNKTAFITIKALGPYPTAE